MQKRTRRVAASLLCVGLSLLLAPSGVTADVYKWKDAQGRTHISDTPPDGAAERLQIRTFSGPAEVSRADRWPPPETARAENVPVARNVIMLSTAWCGVCKRARAWLTQNRIPFTEYDVEHDPKGQAEYRRLRGRGVPIILVGDQRMDGFSSARLGVILQNTK